MEWADDHDVSEAGLLDVGDDRIHPLADGGVARFPGFAPAAGRSTASMRNSGAYRVQFGDSEFPAVACVLTAVDQDEVG